MCIYLKNLKPNNKEGNLKGCSIITIDIDMYF